MMARAGTATLLALDEYARIMGISLPHFNSAILSTKFPIGGRCSDVWWQYAWQDSDKASREELAEAIYGAEQDIKAYLGYSVAPVWETAERHSYPRFHRPDMLRGGGRDSRLFRAALKLRYGRFIAGGKRALVRSIEGAEDHPDDGARAVEKRRVSNKDVVVGLAACGLTPFVRGALRRAQRIGAKTICVTCAPEAVGVIPAEIVINPVVGPEIITGSTRMKAGTATKLVLNTLTTAAMIKLGKVYGNLMVDLRAVNNKLRDRSVRIVMELTGLSRARATALLKRADGKLKPAVVMHFHNVDLLGATRILDECNQSLRKAIESSGRKIRSTKSEIRNKCE